MPNELFYPVGTNTCIMIWIAGQPHAQSNRKTWFGYWKDDGFVKTKHKGRIDVSGQWPALRDRWVDSYLNRTVHAGESVQETVAATSEWCAEAYLETDYDALSQSNFEREVKKFALFNLMVDIQGPESLEDVRDEA